MGRYFRTLVSQRRRTDAALSSPVQMRAIPFEGPVAPSLAQHSDRTKGQCPVDLGSIGRQVSVVAVVQSPKLTDWSQSEAASHRAEVSGCTWPGA